MDDATGSQPWVPLSVREAGLTGQWHDHVETGMPDRVWEHVEPWCRDTTDEVFGDIDWVAEVELDLRRRVALDMSTLSTVLMGGARSRELLAEQVERGEQTDPAQVETDRLDAVDCILGWLDPADEDAAEAVARLDVLLERAGHAYRPRAAGSGHQLVRRLEAAQAAAINQAAEAADERVGYYLNQAVVHTYGRSPSPNLAVQEAVRATERALWPKIAPKDPRPSLGKCIAMLRDQAAQWQLVHTPLTVDQLADQLAVFWRSHRSRHDPVDAAVDHTIEEAELMCVQAALFVRLVEWHLTRR